MLTGGKDCKKRLNVTWTACVWANTIISFIKITVCVHNCEGFFFLLFHTKVETFSPPRESDPVPRHYRPAHIFSCSLFWNRQLLIFFFSLKNSAFAPVVHFMVQKPFFFCSTGQDVHFSEFSWLAPPSLLACLQNGNSKMEFPDDPRKQSWRGADNKRVTASDEPDPACVLYCMCVCQRL